jgi:hypothetical protein
VPGEMPVAEAHAICDRIEAVLREDAAGRWSSSTSSRTRGPSTAGCSSFAPPTRPARNLSGTEPRGPGHGPAVPPATR